MSFFDFQIIDGDVIDLTFVLSDLVDINLTPEEVTETGSLDAQSTHTVHEGQASGRDKGIPIAKRVW